MSELGECHFEVVDTPARLTVVSRSSMSISPRTALTSGDVPSNAKPLCFRTAPTIAQESVSQSRAFSSRGASARRTSAAVSADDPAEALRLELLLVADAFLDRGLDVVVGLLEPDQLGPELDGAAVLLEVGAEDGFRVVLRYLVGVVLSAADTGQSLFFFWGGGRIYAGV